MLKKLINLKTLMCLMMACSLISCTTYQSTRQFPENLIVVLNQDITVESRRARVFLQNGEVTRTGQLKTYEPSCDFEVVEVSKPGAEQIIYADEFRVTRVYFAPPDFTYFNFQPNQQYAHEGFERPNTTFLTQFSLSSESQPSVMRLNCKIWSIEFSQRYLSKAQIDQTLGSIVTFIYE